MKVALDQEWVELIMLAKYLGLTQDEIRDFLLKDKMKADKITG
ncbi:DNA-binding anti-repressor SinI [Siminovitchia acidinfaciens]|uniref:DNA-binding anti-repressor SinI n=1 Tax=Siminovitchia acidinfaciens TaxID=2321395 RepID=A0A429XSY9_9BACI|nr:DNA-binding anti-repressor SinI [Siminovitchia acidinfaciens]